MVVDFMMGIVLLVLFCTEKALVLLLRDFGLNQVLRLVMRRNILCALKHDFEHCVLSAQTETESA